jgi:hypothetical protein
MTKLTQIRLTDTQLIVLSGATQRPDGVLTLPERLKGMARGARVRSNAGLASGCF